MVAPDVVEELRGLLQQMDATCRKLEEVALEEQKAAGAFDATSLARLMELRAACQVDLDAMEAACRDLVCQYGGHDREALSLEAFIDTFPGQEAGALQALRRRLYLRLIRLNETNEKSYLRLRAACDVTTAVLQAAGLGRSGNTYGPGGAL